MNKNLDNRDLKTIKYHNSLNMVAFKSFTSRELEFFFIICSLMKEKGMDEITFSYSELKGFLKDRINSSSTFEKILSSIYDKMLLLNFGWENEEERVKFVLFTMYKMNKKEKKISLQINKEFSYILNELTKNFTVFELQEFNSLSSVYSKNMFRLIKQYKGTGYYKVSIEEFKRVLDIPSTYEWFKINEKVFKPIMKELPSYFPNLAIKKNKKGRTITHLEITFDPQKYETEKYLGFYAAETILCPSCGQKLEEIYSQDNVSFFGHRNFKQGECKLTFSSIEEIETTRKKIEEREKKILQQDNDLQEKNRIIESFKDYLSKENKLFSLESIRENQILLINNQTLELVIFPLTQKGFTSFLEANIKTASL